MAWRQLKSFLRRHIRTHLDLVDAIERAVRWASRPRAAPDGGMQTYFPSIEAADSPDLKTQTHRCPMECLCQMVVSLV